MCGTDFFIDAFHVDSEMNQTNSKLNVFLTQQIMLLMPKATMWLVFCKVLHFKVVVWKLTEERTLRRELKNEVLKM